MKPFFSFFVAAVLCHAFSFARTDVPAKAGNSRGFRENKGQLTDQYENKRKDILYYGSSHEMSYYLKKDGLSYQLYKKAEHSDAITIQRVDITWLGANAGVTTEAQIATGGLEHFYNLPEGKEVLNVKAFETILYKNIYTGIDAKYYHQNGSLKYDFIVKPYADYRKIAFKIEGAERLLLNADGTITISTPLGNITEGKPIAYQEGKPVDVRWVLENNVLSFSVAGYDEGKELVIDPLVYAWEKTYGQNMGGGGGPYSTYYFMALAQNSQGDVILGGNNQYYTGQQVNDIILWKYSSNGIVTNYGSGFNGTINDIRIYNTAMYMCGKTIQATNIATSGAHQITYGGGNEDAFIEKRDTSGNRIWLSYYGGTGIDAANSCTLDSGGNLYVVGYTNSSTNISTPGSYQSSLIQTNVQDGFVVRFDTNGVRKWGTYYGGSLFDAIQQCVVKGNKLLFCGTTSSTTGITTPNSYQPNFSGTTTNGFLTAFDTSGNIIWGTYYGDTASSANYCILDNNGYVYICGSTKAGNNTATTNSFQSVIGGDYDGYLAKFDDNGIRQWGTYFGGTGYDNAQVIAISGSDIYLCGTTDSKTNITTPFSYNQNYPSFSTEQYGFVAQFDILGQRHYSSYITNAFNVIAAAIDSNGDLFIAGRRTYQYVGANGYILKFKTCNVPKPTIVAMGNTNFCSGTSVTLTTTATASYYQWYRNDTLISGATNNTYTAHQSGNYVLMIDSCPNVSNSITLTELSLPNISYNVTHQSCYGLPNGSINISVSNGLPPYTYTWDNLSTTTPALSNVAPGSYIIHVLDANNCMQNDTIIVQQQTYAQPYNIISTKNVPCYGAPLGYISLNTMNGHPPYSYTWENLPDTTATITHLGVGTYVVHTTDSIHCLQTDSITISQETTTAPSSPLAEICAVTVDSATGKNLIIWEKQGDVRAVSYNLYTEGTTEGDYNLIGNNSVNQFSTYLDYNSNPQQRSYLYKISEIDSCNHENPLSTAHKTIHLAANVGLNGQINLNWNPYEGKPYSSHYIMRSVNFGPFILLNQVSSGITSYSDLTPPNGIKIYRIDIDLPTTCNPAKSTAVAHISSNNVQLIDASYLQIVPNPTTGIITIIGARPKTVRVFDAVGKLLMEKTEVDQLQLGELPPAVYLIKLYNETGKLYHQQKIVKR